MHVDGLIGLAVGLFAVATVRFFPDMLSRDAQEMPWVGHGLFVVVPICGGLVRLSGSDLLLTFRVGVFSVLPLAAGLAVLAIWHGRRRAEFLATAALLTFLGLLFGIPLLSSDAVGELSGR